MTLSWRDRQKRFFTDSTVELQQDQRILDWAQNDKIWLYGDVDYFKVRLNSVPESSIADKLLLIINERTNIEDLVILLNNNKGKNSCVSINKFLLYTNKNHSTVNDNYDQALKDIISNIFTGCRIDYFYIPNLKGNNFNFASPASQFFIYYEL